MADKKISQLNAAATIYDADDFAVVQDGETKQANASVVKTYVKAGFTKADAGLGNVDNTSDATKNSATATLTNKTLTSPVINGGTINNAAIGGTTPAAGNFTTLGATGNVTLGDASTDTLTINGTAVSCPNNLNFDSNTLFIDATNNRVGVGTNSVNTQCRLEVLGNVMFRTVATTNTSSDGRIFGGAYTGNPLTVAAINGNNGSNVLAIGGGTGLGEPATRINFHIGTVGALGSGTERIRLESSTFLLRTTSDGTKNSVSLNSTVENALVLDSSGRVGVGTASPSNPLTVTYSNSNFAAGISVVNTDTTTNAWARIDVRNAASAMSVVIAQIPTGTGYVTNAANAHLFIGSNNSSRLVVKSTGQIRFIPLASAPSGAESGDVYYNGTDNKLYCYNGSTWNALF
jgi:hypothetical protein